MTLVILICAFILGLGLLYLGDGYWAWVLEGGIAFIAWAHSGVQVLHLFKILLGIFVFLALLFGVPLIRRNFVSRFLMLLLAKALPRMGETERIALEAGTVWWDAELFSGNPDWQKLLNFKMREISEKERAFLEGPVEELCRRLDDWKIIQLRDLPPEIWDFIKKNKFLGMIIPEKYGGLEFSALAHANVITKLSSRSITAAVTVMVPNSLGPAELLLRYGTEEQKNYYLPRLAIGEEIPCFALTGPEAGSDAAATQSHGVVCRGVYEGKEVLGMRLNWEKRYITLGPVATVIGLAFQLHDPEHFLGEKENLGITCALIPAHLPGIDIGKRHDPMGIPFQNGPNFGHEVFVPLDFIIGGPKMAGKGWRMLMESLGAGRGISLPSLAVGAAQLSTRIVGAYATVREQFDTPIGRFEGIEEPLAKIGGLTYLMTAARRMTLGAIDAGQQPAVITAIVKAYLTEGMRVVVNEAMDIRAGSGIIQGPRNLLGRLYKAVPVGITVEGANILTRSMIIYGQGAIRCHPFVQHEMRGIAEKNLKKFDLAFFGHINFVFKNVMRSWFLGFTGARLARVPRSGPAKRYLAQVTRMSAAFAITSDVAMATLGGTLKRREKISGRLADVLAWMYLASSVLKKFVDEEKPERDLCILRWSCDYALFQIQTALQGILDNLPNRSVAWLLNRLVFPWGARFRFPKDKLGSAVARNLLEDREERLHLTQDIFVPGPEELGLGHLEKALDKAVEALMVETKIRDAVRAGKLDKAPGNLLLESALDAKIITEAEWKKVKEAQEIQNEVIQVDAFDPEIFKQLRD
jgi:acyl-CoA dehydrogenase